MSKAFDHLAEAQKQITELKELILNERPDLSQTLDHKNYEMLADAMRSIGERTEGLTPEVLTWRAAMLLRGAVKYIRKQEESKSL